ncbi:3-Oxoacyl-[acyl-carrier-(ACP)] synthase III family protein [Mycobacterium xenopi 4042]|uniref:3-Oxoacyl-[acyl-carrier-(ACP)] synthase III family protein n=1 Tax=Mycobacterium xenopi 4042 TaxID=1299334 RepID=X7YLI4_MYCXE|nr:3-Oxoacyl-[acyl-carrier-(ACP)] synthase III family protein [Mycobacterium xenopi 4042]
MTEVSLTDVSTYLPGEPISADYYAQFAGSDELRDNLMFRAPKFRHHVGPDESAIDMVEQAAQGLIERHGRDVIENVDVLITHTQMPDMPFYGAGGGIAHRLGMRPSWVLDLHNGGCAAFVLGLNVARKLLTSGEGRTALIAIAQNAAGKSSTSRVSGEWRRLRSPVTVPRSDWSRCRINRRSLMSSAAPTANTPET